jgi:hypothetical protein
MPILGHTIDTFSRNESSTKGEGGLFSVAITMAFEAEGDLVSNILHRHKIAWDDPPLIPSEVAPCETAAKACSIWRREQKEEYKYNHASMVL